MTTIMSLGDSSGTRGRCDARCHQAIHPQCVCMCGGRYHGAAHRAGGVEQAVRDTWEEAIQEAEQKAKAEGMELDTSRLRKFIGLEAANPGNPANTANRSNVTNHEIAVQGTLPLEVA